MATWLQQRAGALKAPDSWAIDDDPPHECRSRMSGFASEADARARIELWRSNGVDVRYCRVVAPAGYAAYEARAAAVRAARKGGA